MKSLQRLLPIALALLTLVGCSSQGSLTHAVFEREEASFRELDLSMKDLYQALHEGSTDAQFKAVNALRHLAEWSDEPGKRQMAARGLVVAAAFVSDGDARDRADSRAAKILTGSDRALSEEVLWAKTKVATGALGLTLDQGTPDETFVMADPDEREEAVVFLTKHFGDLDESLQYQTALAFSAILSNPPNCFKKGYKMVTRTVTETVPNPLYVEPKEGKAPMAGVPKMITKSKIVTEEDKSQVACAKDDAKTQESWKTDLVEEIKDSVGYGELPQYVSAALLAAAANLAYVEDKKFASKAMQGWEEDGIVTKERLPLLQGAINKSKGFYPDLYRGSFDRSAVDGPKSEKSKIDESQPATVIAEQLKAAQKASEEAESKVLSNAAFEARPNFSNPGAYPGNGFWLNNADEILRRQLFNPSTRLASGNVPDGETGFVPQEWINFKGYDGSAEMVELKGLLYQSTLGALNRGYRIENPRGLDKVFKGKLDNLVNAKEWDVERELALLKASWPSLADGGANFGELEKALLEGAERNKENLYLQQRYLLALVAGLSAYPKEEPSVCKALEGRDVYTQLAAFEQVQSYPAYRKPGKASLVKSPRFCGVALYDNGLDKDKVMAPVAPVPAPIQAPKEEPKPQADEPAPLEPATEQPVPAAPAG
ncbi:MAG: hypothetical protein A2600_02345 [Candidatus Lambdaproteobacteria bacterium RIFOXYD1_FULL_56_27]|uniref:HEAT repeat domain-containing protein n=1 Tax=Candidatus Lambdaproteobacteria bacterium RIFOXYD2_FULL_56_26 TaxID=1817773 RepID=A0A1F6H2W3_9PROT|nr:MAG: hypothetical protein A2426_09385 [Candidatus Lambdaproteobacteria bacterium RIFOXYC1_FULL_56_13]OGH04620.1 MAG: hypothetical protein A2557_06410 [Candidatus Lambdaproteobacteria bacterium RIFOXYD2_FULL_56_26]OGH09084.1 MAG: hypothetical protein A2600_02345 [Candidatus Lambdaproteobacteria bacterium RIFOXYD1_FULL_56_27]